MLRPLRIAPACYHVLHLVPTGVGHQKNFFMDEGLTNEASGFSYQIVRGGLVPFGWEKYGLGQAMKEKDIDISTDVLTVTPLYHKKYGRATDMAIIAGWRVQQDACWVAQPGITEVGQLKGKRLGVIDYGDILFRGMRTSLARHGLDPQNDVVWVPGFYPPQNARHIREGTVDAAPMRSWQAEELVKEGYNILVSVKDLYPRGRPDRVIVANRRVLDQRPDDVIAFLRGIIRSYWSIRQKDNFEFVRNVERNLRQESDDPDERLRRLASQGPRHLEAMPFPIDGKATALDVIAQEEYDMGELDEIPDIEELCEWGFVEQAYKDLLSRPELQAEHERVQEVVKRMGY